MVSKIKVVKLVDAIRPPAAGHSDNIIPRHLIWRGTTTHIDYRYKNWYILRATQKPSHLHVQL